MDILVTGATGFIGRYLAGALSKTYSVRCLVRKTSDITPLRDLNVDVTYADLLVKESLGPALDGIDFVYHLAGEVYSRRTNDFYKGNVLATENLLEECEARRIKKIIFLSTVGVYKPVVTKTLITEESECGPIWIYGKTKLEAEELVKKSNIPWVIVRAPLIYGPHQPSIVNRFFLDIINKRKIYVFGKGDDLRSLCFIDNLIGGLLLFANKLDLNRKTFILSDAFPYTYSEIANTACKVIQQRVEVAQLPSFLKNIVWRTYQLMDNIFQLCFVELYAITRTQFQDGFDITRAKKEIGYCPSVTLEEGLRITIDWVRNYVIRGNNEREKSDNNRIGSNCS